MRRREFITLLGGAAAAAARGTRAQQPTMPVVAVVNVRSPDGAARDAAAFAFYKGLNEIGYIVGQNVTVEYHWVSQYEHLPSLMADIVRRRVAVITYPWQQSCHACSQSCDHNDPNRLRRRRRPRQTWPSHEPCPTGWQLDWYQCSHQ
jgi:hypothetical protein